MSNRSLDTGELIRQLSPEIRDYASVVGRWVWVEFEARPPDAILRELKALGFRWNRSRGLWQHPCGHFSKGARGYDPRDKYGCRPLLDVKEELGL